GHRRRRRLPHLPRDARPEAPPGLAVDDRGLVHAPAAAGGDVRRAPDRRTRGDHPDGRAAGRRAPAARPGGAREPLNQRPPPPPPPPPDSVRLDPNAQRTALNSARLDPTGWKKKRAPRTAR